MSKTQLYGPTADVEIQGPRAGRSRTFHLPADGEGSGQDGQNGKNILAALIPLAVGFRAAGTGRRWGLGRQGSSTTSLAIAIATRLRISSLLSFDSSALRRVGCSSPEATTSRPPQPAHVGEEAVNALAHSVGADLSPRRAFYSTCARFASCVLTRGEPHP